MTIRARHLLLIALFCLASCRAIAKILLLPFVLFAWIASIFVGSEGLTNQEELRAGGIRVDQHLVEFRIDSELTYAGTVETIRTVTSPAGLADAQMASHTYDPRTQTLVLEYAAIVDPDGRRREVAADQVFTRPSAATLGAPSFANSLTQTVLFPQLRVGSQTRVKWSFKETGHALLGFNYSWRPSFTLPVGEARIKITYKDDVPLHFDSRGPFSITATTERGGHVIEAILRDYVGQVPEKAMVSPRDLCPEFVASTIDSWETIGARFHEAVAAKVETTPEIDALAAKIVGEREGLEAACAIHRWVCGNIQYVAIYMRQMSGWEPHSASEVLRNGYGDCKDQVVLLASLLKSRGIEAEAVLVNFDRSFEPYPLATALQFDHCMAYLPVFDLYSNPTDPYRDLGELNVMLSGKFVVIASSKGRVSRTPEGSADKNRYRVEQRLVIGADGLVNGHAKMDFAGRPSGRFRRTLALAASDEQAVDDLLVETPLGGSGELRTSDATDLNVPLHCEGEWTTEIPFAMAAQFSFKTPVGLDMLNLAFLTHFISTRTRQYPTLISAGEASWRQQIKLPAGYTYASVPKGRLVQNDAGRFESHYALTEDGQLVVERTLRIERDRYSADQYAALRQLLLEAAIDFGSTVTAQLGV